jgi:hypothetical protein
MHWPTVFVKRDRTREGDIFDPAVSHFLRIRIQTALRNHEIEVGELLADITAEVPPGTERPRVNERFPWEWGAAVPLFVLEVLPELPEDLEYRLAGRELVLVDIHAELVVDIMPGALPPPGPGGVLTSVLTPIPIEPALEGIMTSSASQAGRG